MWLRCGLYFVYVWFQCGVDVGSIRVLFGFYAGSMFGFFFGFQLVSSWVLFGCRVGFYVGSASMLALVWLYLGSSLGFMWVICWV